MSILVYVDRNLNLQDNGTHGLTCGCGNCTFNSNLQDCSIFSGTDTRDCSLPLIEGLLPAILEKTNFSYKAWFCPFYIYPVNRKRLYHKRIRPWTEGAKTAKLLAKPTWNPPKDEKTWRLSHKTSCQIASHIKVKGRIHLWRDLRVSVIYDELSCCA